MGSSLIVKYRIYKTKWDRKKSTSNLVNLTMKTLEAEIHVCAFFQFPLRATISEKIGNPNLTEWLYVSMLPLTMNATLFNPVGVYLFTCIDLTNSCSTIFQN